MFDPPHFDCTVSCDHDPEGAMSEWAAKLRWVGGAPGWAVDLRKPEAVHEGRPRGHGARTVRLSTSLAQMTKGAQSKRIETQNSIASIVEELRGFSMTATRSSPTSYSTLTGREANKLAIRNRSLHSLLPAHTLHQELHTFASSSRSPCASSGSKILISCKSG